MLNQRKITIATIFYLILLFLNVIYFFIYFSLLNLPFNLLQLFFIVISTASYFLLLSFLRHPLWQAVCYGVAFMLYISSLANFAYYQVFRAFIDFSLNQAGQLGSGGMINQLKDFYFLVPAKLYWFSAIIFLSVLFNSVLYLKFSSREVEKFLFNFSWWTVVSKKGPRSARQILVLVMLFCAVNLMAFGASSYLYNNPRETWWDLKNQFSDLGFLGYFYTQVYAKSGDEEKVAADCSYFEQTKADYAMMADLGGGAGESLTLPAYDSPPNILVIQLESAGSWAIENNPSPMPYLRELMNNNVSFENFQANSCETVNAEFSSLCSFWPNSYEPVGYSHQKNDYNCLPRILKQDYGYESYYFHSDTPEFWNRDVLIPKWGFENTFFTPYFRQKQDDASVFSQSIEVLADSPKPFFGYMISFTSHSPHNQELIDYQAEKNNLQIAPFKGKLDPWLIENSELSEKEIRLYFGFLRSVDDALKITFDKLEQKKLLKNTIVIIYNDHRYYSFKEDEQLAAFKAYNRSPMVIVFPHGRRQKISAPVSHLDIAPTILNLIEGENYQPPENFLGASLFSTDRPAQILNKCLGQIYFVNDNLIIAGSAKADRYQILDSKKELRGIEKDRWLDLISELVKDSDQAIYNNELVVED